MVITLFQGNPQPLAARMTIQKLIDLGYKTLPHLLYSLDLSPIDNYFYQASGHFLRQKTFHSKIEAEMAFKDFLASKPLEFYRTGINKLVNQWQKCIRSYFDSLKNYFNSLIQEYRIYSKTGSYFLDTIIIQSVIIAVFLNYKWKSTSFRFSMHLYNMSLFGK